MSTIAQANKDGFVFTIHQGGNHILVTTTDYISEFTATIILDPDTKANLTLDAFDQIVDEWLEDQLYPTDAVA